MRHVGLGMDAKTPSHHWSARRIKNQILVVERSLSGVGLPHW